MNASAEAIGERPILPRVLRAALLFIGVLPFLVPIARRYLLPARAGDLLDVLFAPICHRLPERTIAIAGVLMLATPLLLPRYDEARVHERELAQSRT